MGETNLSQAEADALIALEKHRANEDRHDFPTGGQKLAIPLWSQDRREQFLLDISCGRIDLSRVTYQNRARQVVVLFRLDMSGPPHRNPNDEEISCPHLHMYREGYGDKWASPVPPDKFRRLSDLADTLEDFMRHCNIITPPRVERGLF